ncbi:NAD-dependent succinate-semialdehyde dehydrogenase [Halalkalicoccus jeotgali]|uniref:aldehyde dehydrogenase n=1 Tax=Halalkalicoccus jeotgali (strain DSM 18796 / CECT 7217 / JCM 14584 / KCTC 4019 / B3) TaxID=795797 RepID=D8J2N0_HALJB|nr:NAD-dependent succinate-semialdehyde dehydrogenase [Halalkalicoccus jeotgali]ADJ14987.1 Aldehyde Dehydrogenase [Halalkalicoccus jeotgali B3]ELY34997.1 aldehyde dehydrogenase [Halalkalicoccus jeotgali B3]
MESVNPATGETLETYDDHTEADVDRALDNATEAFDEWRERPISERQVLLSNAADVLRENEEEYAQLMTEEMGKPITGARAEVEKCAWVCDFYAERADEFLADEVLGSEPDSRSLVSYEPLGPVLAVMPWNFPFWQVFRFAAPHLTAGNVGLLKHASNVPGCAKAIEEVFEEAGYPEDVFSSLLVGSDAIEDVIRDDRLAAVTLTGSEGAGRAVAETAGSEIKKTVLELGGSDPFVVLDDADIEAAAETGAQARTINSGQSCIAAKRFIVHEAVYEEFVERFTEEMESLSMGDPMDEGTDVGPQAREDLVEDVHDQVERSVEAGATLRTGGERPDEEGNFYPPTVLTEVPQDAAAATEEVFGPAAAVFRVESEEEAIELANDTDFGLGASIWTDDLERGDRLARRIEAGCVFVNELVKSDPRIPFGGVKNSGYGRELAQKGIHEFVNEKTVWVQSPGGADDVATE